MSKLLLESLVPKDKPTVMQLVKTAGIDVSDWQKYKGGKKRAASNPKYCYDWSFIDDKGTTVMNLWYQNLTIRNGDIVAELNYRRKFTTSSSIANGVMNARSEKFDGALRRAYEQSLPIRVIINDGVRRSRNIPDAKASSVKKRMLDTIPWFVRSYEFSTGDCIVNRGIISKSSMQNTTSDRSNAEDAVEQEELERIFKDAEHEQLIEQLKLTQAKAPRVEIIQHKQYYRDNKTIAMLKIVRGYRCQICGTTIPKKDGRFYIEAAHITPKSQLGNELPENILILCPNHHKEFDFGERKIIEKNKHHIRFTLNGKKIDIPLSLS